MQILGFKDHIELSQADAIDETDLQGNDSDSEMLGLEDDDDEDDDDEENEVPGLQRHVTIKSYPHLKKVNLFHNLLIIN